MLGAFGATLLFICTLCGATLVGAYVFLFAARSMLVAMQGTAVGEDEIRWPDEPLLDWMGGSLHVAALALLWLVPISFVARGLGPSLAPGDPLRGYLYLAVPGLWLFFPIGLLSSLSATSRWVFFRPAIAAALLRIGPSAALFYFVSAALSVGVAALWYFALMTAAWVLIPAALIGAAVVLIYGRLLGRLAWLIHRLNPARPSRPRADLPIVTRPKKNKATRKRPRREPATPAVDPWAAPEEEGPTPKQRRKVRDPWGREIEEPEGYGLSKEPPRPPVEESPPRRPALPDDEDDGPEITLARQEHEEPPPEPAAPKEPDRATKLAMELRERKPPAPPPPWPLFSGVYTFPWYEQSLKAWVWLSFGGLVLGFLVRTLIQSMLG